MPDPAPRRVVTGSVVVATAAAVGSYLVVRSGRGDAIDRRVARLLTRPLGPAADRAIAVATDVGSVYGLAGMTVVLAVMGHRRLAGDVAGAGAVAWTSAQAAKPLLARERPFEATGTHRLVAIPAGSSWPSGHAAVAAAMATTIAPSVGPLARLGLAAAAGGVGLSRLYAGVHHLMDVVAGWGLGALSTVVWNLVRRAARGGQRRR